MKRRLYYLALSSTAFGGAFLFYKHRDTVLETLDIQHQLNYQRLIRLAHSNRLESKRMGITGIANLGTLPDWQAMQIAQQCDPSVLAAFVLNDIRIDKYLTRKVALKDKGTLEHQLHELLESLSEYPVDVCISFFTELALRKPKKVTQSEELEILWQGAEDTVDPTRLSDRPDLNRLILMIRALGAQSTVPEQCQRLIDLGGLDVLRRVWNWRTNPEVEKELKSLVLKVLANFSLHHQMKWFIVQTGWMPILRKCIRKKEKLEYQLLARKILHNLASDDVKFEDGVYLIHDVPYARKEAKVDVVFIHGLRGGLFWTWRQKDAKQAPMYRILTSRNLSNTTSDDRTRCWPKDWLPDDVEEPIRVLGIDYASFLSDWTPQCSDYKTRNSMESRSLEIMRKLKAAGLGQRPIVWVAHSMGGLFVKQMLCFDAQDKLTDEQSINYKPIVDNSIGCVFYSVPHYGSPGASRIVDSRYRYLFMPSLEVQECRENSPYLISLHADFRRMATEGRIDIVNVIETIKSRFPMKQEMFVVPERSASGGFGRVYLVNETHFNTCKPTTRHSINYRILVDFLNETFDNLSVI